MEIMVEMAAFGGNREIFMTYRQIHNKIRKSHSEKDLKFLLQGKLMIKKI